MTQKITLLMDQIFKIHSDTIQLSLALATGHYTLRIQKNVSPTCDPQQYTLFCDKLNLAFTEGGGLTIREFLSIKQKKTLPNGEVTWIPEKNLYGFFLGAGKCHVLTKDQLADMHEIDASTGQHLPPEKGVHYQELHTLSETLNV